MFTSPTPAAPSLSAVSPSLPTSLSHLRPSRLRDLSTSLRHYRTQREPQIEHPALRQRSRNVSSPPAPSPTTATAGQTVVTRTATAPDEQHEPRLLQSFTSEPTPTLNMTRNRAETAAPQLSVRNQPGPTPTSPSPEPNMEAQEGNAEGSAPVKHLPSIRLIPHQDQRPGRPSLQFPTMSRTLPDESAVIRVGRYSERDNAPEIPTNSPSAAPVGFKSKVVSRKHCELWCKDSQWYIKDVKSSSGTFLNRIRLSQPNSESKPFKIKDGDIIQLGIDFRGGEEMIFRCVKIRVECNRGWQQGLNTFNKQTHQRLRNLAKRKESDSASTHASECSICLMSIAPCQSLFVAPCSHVWHYKCIRPILNGPTWPNFLCPNCRAVADLEADAEDPGDFEEWDDVAVPAEGSAQENGVPSPPDRQLTPRPSAMALANGSETLSNEQGGLSDLAAALSSYNIADPLTGVVNQSNANPSTPERFTTPAHSSSVTQPVTIQFPNNNDHGGLSPMFPNASSGLSAGAAQDCPMTPRNDAGPFVLDGSAGRGTGNPSREGSVAPTLPPLHID